MLKNVLKIIPICSSRKLAVGLKQNVLKPIFMVSSTSIIGLENSKNEPKVLFHKVISNTQDDILFGIKSWLNDLIRILKIIFRTIQMTIYLTPLLVTAPLGKKHAYKKYDKFALNASCFWGNTGSNFYYLSCAISRNFCYKNNEIMKKLINIIIYCCVEAKIS